MARKKLPNPAGGFKARYGSTLRKRWSEVIRSVRATYDCPRCETNSVKRISIGIWMCRKCGYKFAGQAYTPSAR